MDETSKNSFHSVYLHENPGEPVQSQSCQQIDADFFHTLLQLYGFQFGPACHLLYMRSRKKEWMTASVVKCAFVTVLQTLLTDPVIARFSPTLLVWYRISRFQTDQIRSTK